MTRATVPVHSRGLVLIAIAFALGATTPAHADLQQKTVDAFDRYVRLSESRMEGEERSEQGFLYTDRLPPAEKTAAERQARSAVPFMTRVETRDGNRGIDVPDGLIHHWVGVIFMPGVTVDQAVALMQAYDRHADVFAPVIVRSRTLAHDGDHFRFYLRFYVKKIIGVTTDTEHEAVFGRPAPARAFSRLHSHPRRRGGECGYTHRAPEARWRGAWVPVAAQHLLAVRGARRRHMGAVRVDYAHTRHPDRARVADRPLRHRDPEGVADLHARDGAEGARERLGARG